MNHAVIYLCVLFPHSWLRKQMYSINQTKTKRYSLHIHATVSPLSEKSFLIVSLCV